MIGRTLSHYRIVEKLGEGGMGVVWKAADTQLQRDVAIKVLPEHFARDPEHLGRFEREAKLLASLNHRNIAAIYGLEVSDGVRFLVMELVEGEDLARRLARGPLSVEEAIDVCHQLARALEAAHDKGVLHRDLKPANVQVTDEGRVKVLDFGLAKAFEVEGSDVDPSLSPTLTSAGSRAGVILGTAAYMSPEQARGKTLDKRTDIWAFGCVLFECLTGKQAFADETTSDILAAVLRAEPDWAVLPPGLPDGVTGLLRRCLVKNPVDRLRDMGDARITLGQVLASQVTGTTKGIAGPAAAHRRRGWMAWMFPLALALTALVTAAVVMKLLPTEPHPLRKFLLLGPGQTLDPGVAPCVSPGGTKVIYSSEGQLWIRSLDRFDPRPVPNSSQAHAPFWSSDGNTVAFYSSRKLWRAPAGGGEPTMIADVPDVVGAGGGGAWFPDGSIYIATGFAGLLRVSARGGDPVPALEPGPDESDFHNVSALPDGKGMLFIVHREVGFDTVALWDGQERKQIVQLEGLALSHPAYSSSGHILFERGGSNPGIWAVPFSLDNLEVTGEPFLVVAEGSRPSVSRDGTLLYLPKGVSRRRQMFWMDREGKELGDLWDPKDGLQDPALSPDGRRVAVSIDEGGKQKIWVYDLVSEAGHRLTFTPGPESAPAWTPDGRRIAFNCTQGSPTSICIKSADGTGETRTLIREGSNPHFSPDGKTLVYHSGGEGTRFDVWYEAVEGGAEPTAILQSPDAELRPRISPDGRYLAYTSWADGIDLFIVPFPQGEGKWHVGKGGRSRWNQTGDELFYLNESDFMAVSVEPVPSMTLGTPVKLFSASGGASYDVARDGQRFLLLRNLGELENPNVAVVQSWFAEFSVAR